MQASRRTLFEGGGDDAAQPNDITMLSIPTHATSTWTSKVNAILSTNPNTPPLDGILPKPLPLCIDRCHTTNTDAKGDAEGVQQSKPSKTYTWKWRRKKSMQLQGAVLPPGVRYYRQAGTTAPLPPDCLEKAFCWRSGTTGLGPALPPGRYYRPQAGTTAPRPVLPVHSGLRA